MAEWIIFGKSFACFLSSFDCFEDAVGIQLELSTGSRYLIGNVSAAGALCGDCADFRDRTIVARYRRLLTRRQLEG